MASGTTRSSSHRITSCDWWEELGTTWIDPRASAQSAAAIAQPPASANEPRSSEPQQLLAQRACPRPAHRQLLSRAQRHDVGAAGHRAHLRDRVDRDERRAREADEGGRVEARLEVLEPVRDRVVLAGT